MEPVRIAIIGTGGMGCHYAALIAGGKVESLALTDVC